MTATLAPPPASVTPGPLRQPVPSTHEVGAGVVGPTVASGIAVLLSALALGPLFDGAGWFGATLLVVIVVVAVSGIATRLHVPVFLIPVISAGALFATLVSRFTDGAPWDVVPTPEALDRLRTVLGQGMADIDRYAPPVPSSEGVAAVVALGLGCVALTVVVLHVNLRLPTLAGIPLVAIYVVPSFVLDDGSPWWSFALVVAGWLVLIVSDERVGLMSWGKLLRRPDRGSVSSPLTGHASSALRLGAVAILTAIALPILIPGLADAVLGRVASGTGDGEGDGVGGDPAPDQIGLDPLVSLRRDLLELPDITVMRYSTTATSPSYLRTVVLEVFDGDTWRPRGFSTDNAVRISDGLRGDDGRDPTVATTSRRYDLRSVRFASNYLPLPENATRVALDGEWFSDGATGTVFGPDASTKDAQWSVDALEIDPTPAQLRTARDIPADAQLALSADTPIPDSLRETARTVVADTGTKYAAAVALQDWFRANFTYSTNVRSDQSAPYLEQFLRDRVGYCEQFAATMALMSRSLGIPARVVVGFTPGTKAEDGLWDVSAKDAHAWPELFFSGIGWVRFEPTPRGAADGGSVSVPGWTRPGAQTPAGAGSPTANPDGRPNPRQVPEDSLDQPSDAAALAAAAGAATPTSADEWRRRGIAVIAAIALVLGLVPGTVRWLRRRRRLSATGTVEDAWSELRDTTRDLGLIWSDAQTPRQAVAAVIETNLLAGDAAAAVTRVGRATEQSRYALTPPAASALADDVRTVRGALLRRVDRTTRWRAALMPASLRSQTG